MVGSIFNSYLTGKGSIVWLPVESWGSNSNTMSQFLWVLDKITEGWRNKSTLRSFIGELLNFFNIIEQYVNELY
jgi:hypothetical protein